MHRIGVGWVPQSRRRRRSSRRDRSRQHTDALWPHAHAAHGCPLATCGSPGPWSLSKHGDAVRRTITLGGTRMPSGHVRTPRTDALRPHADRPAPFVTPCTVCTPRHGCPLATCTRVWSPPSEAAALTGRVHPLGTPGAMPGNSVCAHRCGITRPLPLRTTASCLSVSPMPAAHAAAQPNLRYHVGTTRGGSVARHGGSGSETRRFIPKRTYTRVLLVHPPVPIMASAPPSSRIEFACPYMGPILCRPVAQLTNTLSLTNSPSGAHQELRQVCVGASGSTAPLEQDMKWLVLTMLEPDHNVKDLF